MSERTNPESVSPDRAFLPLVEPVGNFEWRRSEIGYPLLLIDRGNTQVVIGPDVQERMRQTLPGLESDDIDTIVLDIADYFPEKVGTREKICVVKVPDRRRPLVESNRTLIKTYEVRLKRGRRRSGVRIRGVADINLVESDTAGD